MAGIAGSSEEGYASLKEDENEESLHHEGFLWRAIPPTPSPRGRTDEQDMQLGSPSDRPNLNWKTPLIGSKSRKPSSQSRQFFSSPDENRQTDRTRRSAAPRRDHDSQRQPTAWMTSPFVPRKPTGERSLLQQPTVGTVANSQWKTPSFSQRRAENQEEEDNDDQDQDQGQEEIPATPVRIIDDADNEKETFIREFERDTEWRRERGSRKMRSGVSKLDRLLSLGESEDEVTRGYPFSSSFPFEIVGTPSSGKTSMVLQMAVLERLSSLVDTYSLAAMSQEDRLQTWSREAAQVYIIDTEGSVSIRRILDIAKSHIAHHLDAARWGADSKRSLLKALLQGLHIVRVTSLHALVATLRCILPKWLEAEKKAREANVRSFSILEQEGKQRLIAKQKAKALPHHTSMIIIDTVSYHFRGPPPSDAIQRRARLIGAEEVRRFAKRCKGYEISLICTNQMAFKVVGKGGTLTNFQDKEGKGRLFASLKDNDGAITGTKEISILGEETWRIVLFRAGERGQRHAQIMSRPKSVESRAFSQRQDQDDEDREERQDSRKPQWKEWVPFHIQLISGIVG